MANVFSIPRGTDRDFPLKVVDAYSGADFLLDGTYNLSAEVWIGDNVSPLISPSVFIDGTPPTPNFVVRFSVANTTALEPGDYFFQAYATKDGVRRAIISDEPAILRIEPTAGSTAAKSAWITADELKGYFPAADQMLASGGSQSGFLEERVAATENFRQAIVDRYLGRPGFARFRGTTYHPVHGYDVPDRSRVVPSKTVLRAALDANRLTLDPIAKEIIARMALAKILGHEITNDPRINPYVTFGEKGEAKATSLWSTWQAYMDMDGDSTEDAIIDVDITFLE